MRWHKKQPTTNIKTDEWFAWYPVHTGFDYYAWLEKVSRTRVYVGFSKVNVLYSEIGKKNT